MSGFLWTTMKKVSTNSLFWREKHQVVYECQVFSQEKCCKKVHLRNFRQDKELRRNSSSSASNIGLWVVAKVFSPAVISVVVNQNGQETTQTPERKHGQRKVPERQSLSHVPSRSICKIAASGNNGNAVE